MYLEVVRDLLQTSHYTDASNFQGLYIQVSQTTNDVILQSSGSSGGGFKFYSGNAEKVGIDTSGNITMPSGIKLYLDGGTNTYIASSDGVIDFYGDNTQLFTTKQNGTQNEVVVNEGSGDVDFRVEANNDQHTFLLKQKQRGSWYWSV